MQMVGRFEKVSYQKFLESMKEEFYAVETEEGFSSPDSPEFEQYVRTAYDNIRLPRRATVGSAGYDICTPMPFRLPPNGGSIKIPTGVRVKIESGWFLGCVPRSGLGFKYKARLANTFGVIDSDYYHSSNEGQIFIKLCNEGEKTIEAREGDAVVQGIFLEYGITYDDDADATRDGGFGSTGR